MLRLHVFTSNTYLPSYVHFGGVPEMKFRCLLENVESGIIHVIHLLYNVDFLTRPRFKIP